MPLGPLRDFPGEGGMSCLVSRDAPEESAQRGIRRVLSLPAHEQRAVRLTNAAFGRVLSRDALERPRHAPPYTRGRGLGAVEARPAIHQTRMAPLVDGGSCR